MERKRGIAGTILVAACVAAAAVFWLGLAPRGTCDPGTAEAPAIPYFKLRFKLTTTAQAARLTFGSVANLLSAREYSVTGEAKKRRVSLNQIVTGSLVSGSPTTLTADYAAKPEIADQPLACTFEQLAAGTSTLRVYSVVGASQRLLQTVTKTTPDSASIQLDLSGLDDDDTLTNTAPRIAEQRMLWAFYYPWYNAPWDSSILLDRPSIGYYNSSDQSVITYHVNKAQWAGIDGFLSSWWGPGDQTDSNLGLLLNIAAAKGFKAMINFETLENDKPRSPSTIVTWLTYALSTHGSHPAYMKVGGMPVIVLWASDTIPAATWEQIFENVRARGFDATYIAMTAGDWPTTLSLESANGWHYYNILFVIQAADEVPTILAQAYSRVRRTVRNYPLLMWDGPPRIWAATAQPGYDDHLIPGRANPILDRDNGALYRATFDAAINCNPDWIFLTSWNEWWEHTHIEPSVNHGNKYLQITREYANAWKGSPSEGSGNVQERVTGDEIVNAFRRNNGVLE